MTISHEAQRVNPKHIVIMQPSQFILKGPLQIVLIETAIGSIYLGGCIWVLTLLVAHLLCSRPQLCQTLSASWNSVSRHLFPRKFCRQEYSGGLTFPPPGCLPDPGIKPSSLASSTLAGGFFSSSTTWKASDHLLSADTSFSATSIIT